jgi:hypothetical protein
MALKAIVETLEGVEHAAFYRETEIDGKTMYVLDVEGVGGYQLENVAGLKSALEKTKSEVAAKKAALDGFKGLNAETVRQQLAELQELQGKAPEASKAEASRVKQLAEQWKREREGLEAKANTYKSVIDDTLRRQTAVQAIAAAGGNVDLLLPHVLSQTKTREEGGRFLVDVVTAEGVARIKDASNNMSISDLVGEMKASPVFGVAFKGTEKSGSGSSQSQAASSGKWDSTADDETKVAYLENRMQR